jgi:hypothetical protein
MAPQHLTEFETHPTTYDIDDMHSNLPESFSLPSWREISLPGHDSLSLDAPGNLDLDGQSRDTLGDALDGDCESSEDDSEEILERLQESEQLSREDEARMAIGDVTSNILVKVFAQRHIILAEYMGNKMAINTLRIIGWKIRTHTTRESYNDLRATLAESFGFDSEYKALELLANLSGLKPIPYHCCTNSCIAYTGKYASLTICPFCQEPRYFDNAKQTPCYKFLYIPLIPQLKSIFANPTYRDLCAYRGDHIYSPDAITDYCDGSHYRTLLQKNAEIIHEDGRKEVLPHKHFSDKRDIALGLFTDGFQLFKKSRVQKSATPILLVNLNLPPTIRTHLD